MKYSIFEKETFNVSGLQIKLSTSQRKNFKIITQHWQNFNNELKINNIKLKRNWLKYGITEKINGEYFYFIAIPSESDIIGFTKKEIKGGRFVCFEHAGKMDLIKSSIFDIYKNFIPKCNFEVEENRTMMHYEQYDHRFLWNKSNSIVEIYLPIKSIDERKTSEFKSLLF